jgi:hypothetical protein
MMHRWILEKAVSLWKICHCQTLGCGLHLVDGYSRASSERLRSDMISVGVTPCLFFGLCQKWALDWGLISSISGLCRASLLRSILAQNILARAIAHLPSGASPHGWFAPVVLELHAGPVSFYWTGYRRSAVPLSFMKQALAPTNHFFTQTPLGPASGPRPMLKRF